MEYELLSKHPEWSTVLFIVETLKSHGHQAVLAGGCVRDALLGKLAKDLDVATNATPDQIESYFPRVLPLGKSFGVCRVIQGDDSIEVATFREESDYRDGRRPSQVEYSTLEKDAERRDFTINALFYDITEKKVIDSVGGREDLKNKILRCVGDADRRMSEDYLRILRGVRFLGQLQLSVDHNTMLALQKHVVFLPRISRERIYDELNKMFVPQAISHCWRNLALYKILDFVFPEWEFFRPLKALEQNIHMNQVMERLQLNIKSPSPIFGWISFYHLRSQQQVGKATEREYMDFKVPRSTIETCRGVVDAEGCVTMSGDDVLKVFMNTVMSGCLETAEMYWDALLDSKQFSQKISELKKQYFIDGKLPEPLVNGHDLIKNGMQQGPEMKSLLQALYLEQLNDKEKTKIDLMKSLLIKSHKN
ncbi:MAG: CCA tRNA nucleotidyltransferase [Bdellovibrionaceae bacterium]|nr:CCA tRNA nucleotidyltransferase [Pseudobdellovibrionaceae bacterium]